MKKKTIAFVLSLCVSILLTLWVKEPQFNDSQMYVLFLLFFSIGLWVTEAIPPFSVGLLILAFLAFSLGNPRFNSEPQNISKYVNTFSSSVIWLMLGGFFLSSALTKTGLDSDLFGFTIRVSGATHRRVFFGLMITTMLASTLMSNTAITAMVLAAIMPLLKNLGKESPLSKALLLGVPFSATTGGMATIIGTPANVITAGALENAGISMDFLHWMYYGVPITLFLTAVGCFVLSKIFIKEDQPLSTEFLQQNAGKIITPEMKTKRKIVIGVVGITVLLWMTSSLHNLSVSAVAAIPIVFLTMTGILDGKDVRALPWDTLLLVAGGLSLGLALQETGLLNHYAQKLVSMEIHYLIFICLLGYITMLFANVMSHTATSSVMIPLGMAILPQYKTEVALVIGLSSSTALFLPVSTPANAVAYSTGLMDQKDFRVNGLLMAALGPAAVILWVLLSRGI
ncbi:MAG: transporter [Acidobacteria bacterium]|nr:MAG: transporter [Acidobacteriota bacterium]